MKRILNLILLIAALVTINNHTIAQTPYDDFAQSSKKKEMLKLPESTFRAYNTDTTNTIKYIEFDKETFALNYFDKNDSLIKTTFVSPIEFKWWTVDPHANKYPSMSPYNFVANNPINAFDPNGKDVVFLIDKEGAGGKGHMGMLFQDKQGNWNYFSQGMSEEGSTAGILSGSKYAGGVGIQPMQTKTSSGEVIQMTKEQAIAYVQAGNADGTKYDNNITLKTTNRQDEIITDNAYKLQEDFKTQKEKYNVYTNNCRNAAQDVVEGTKGTKTGISLPNSIDPRPNEYFKKLQATIPWLNGEIKLDRVPSTMDNVPSKQIAIPDLQKQLQGKGQ